MNGRERRRERNGGSDGVSLADALAHHRAGRLAQAETRYRRILEAQPDNPDALHLLGLVLFQTNRPGRAVPLIREAIARNARVAGYHANLGRVYAGMGRHGRVSGGDSARPRHGGGARQPRRGPGGARPDGAAETAYRGALRLTPDDPDLLFNLANAVWAARRFEDAIDLYRRVVARAPDHIGAWINLGQVLAAAEDHEAALRVHDEALAIRPDDVELNVNRGVALMRLRRLDEAVEALRKAVAMAPHYDRAHYSLGLACKHRFGFEEAQRRFERALALEPDNALAMIELGGCLQRRNRVEDAYGLYGRAYRTDRTTFNGIVKMMTALPHGRFSADYARVRTMLQTAGL